MSARLTRDQERDEYLCCAERLDAARSTTPTAIECPRCTAPVGLCCDEVDDRPFDIDKVIEAFAEMRWKAQCMREGMMSYGYSPPSGAR